MAETRKTRKRPTNRIEKIKMKIKPITLQKKHNKKVYCTICEETSGAHKFSVCDQFFMLFVEVTEKTVRVSDSTSLTTSV
jgi:hypothetical protein